MLSLGTIPEWFAAIGTVGALFVSLHLLREDRRLRKVAQATHVSVWAEWERGTEINNVNERQYFAYVNNASAAPIYVESMEVRIKPASPPALLIKLGTVPAHETSSYGLDEASFLPSSDPPHVKIRFLDTNRARWVLDSNASLQVSDYE